MSNFEIMPPVIAHRGDSSAAPENTLAAIKLAASSGAKWVEFDVKLTHDGMPIILHDETLDRTTNGKGKVSDKDWSDIQKLDAGSWFKPEFRGEPVPLLKDVLNCIVENGLRAMIELKPCPGRAKVTTMVGLIEAAKILNDNVPPPMILSFDREALLIAGQLQPHWPRALLFHEWDASWHDQTIEVGAEALGINAEILTRENLEVFLSAKLPIFAYTVNDAEKAKELLRKGIKAVFSDAPRAMIAAL